MRKFFENIERAVQAMGVNHHDCHYELPNDDKFNGLGLGAGAISLQEAMVLAGLIYVERPDIIIELGTANGASAVFMAAVCKDVGFGKVVSVDKAPTVPKRAFEIRNELDLPLMFVCDVLSMEYLKFMTMEQPIDPTKKYLVFSDTEIKERPAEVDYVLNNFPDGTVVAIHDTSNRHPYGPMNLLLNITTNEKVRDYIEFSSPRGLTVIRK